ncbi:MAG: hypothetical protein ACLFUS_09115 [Candidatus Sumerlaeia bacterium]
MKKILPLLILLLIAVIAGTVVWIIIDGDKQAGPDSDMLEPTPTPAVTPDQSQATPVPPPPPATPKPAMETATIPEPDWNMTIRVNRMNAFIDQADAILAEEETSGSSMRRLLQGVLGIRELPAIPDEARMVIGRNAKGEIYVLMSGNFNMEIKSSLAQFFQRIELAVDEMDEYIVAAPHPISFDQARELTPVLEEMAALSEPELSVEIFMPKFALPLAEKRNERLMQTLANTTEEVRMGMLEDVAVSSGRLEFLRQCESLRMNVRFPENMMETECRLQAVKGSALAACLEEEPRENLSELAAMVPANGAVRLVARWNWGAMRNLMDSIVWTTIKRIDLGPGAEYDSAEKALREALEKRYNEEWLATFPLLLNGIGLSTLLPEKSPVGIQFFAGSEVPHALESGFLKMVDYVDEIVMHELADSELTKDIRNVGGISIHRFGFLANDMEDKAILGPTFQAMSASQDDGARLGGEYVKVGNTLAVSFEAGTIDGMAGLLQGKIDGGPVIPPMAAIEGFGADNLAAMDLDLPALVSWAYEYRRRLVLLSNRQNKEDRLNKAADWRDRMLERASGSRAIFSLDQNTEEHQLILKSRLDGKAFRSLVRLLGFRN